MAAEKKVFCFFGLAFFESLFSMTVPSNPTSLQEHHLSDTVKNLTCFYNTKINNLSTENNNLRAEIENLKKRFYLMELRVFNDETVKYDGQHDIMYDAGLVYGFSKKVSSA